MPVRKGDEVSIKRGDFRGKTGKVSKVELKKLRIFVEGVKQKKISGQEVDAPIQPSNVVITNLNLDDKERLKSISKQTKMVTKK